VAARETAIDIMALRAELETLARTIERTMHEIATIRHPMMEDDRVRGAVDELGTIVAATEVATDQILDAAEAIEGLAKGASEAKGAPLSEPVTSLTTRIYEACNFQDLTGQRINKVMTTMKFIEHHINVMMEIWGGVDAIKAHAPAIVDERVGDARLLNGPKGLGEEGHASQNDIDAMFG
jgi:chemotaxis protein CheZ